MKRAALAIVLASCASADRTAPSPPASTPHLITSLAGEVHLHQFPLGSHPLALFLAEPVPIDARQGDSIVEIDTAPTAVDGACTLYLAPQCSACGAGQRCTAPDVCSASPRFAFVDAGAVTVTGSAIVPSVRFWYDAPTSDYVSTPAPGGTQLFAGREQLRVRGGGEALAFDDFIPAPLAVTLTEPDPASDLRVPVSDAMHVAWASEGSDSVEIVVFASSDDSRSGFIRCFTTDGGALPIPASLVARLPPPPRATRIEVSRIEQRIVPTARDGVGVFLHVAQTTWMNGRD